MPQEAIVREDAPETVTDPALKEMIEAGVFYGRVKNRTNPRMRPYILTNRNGVEIINLEKTKEAAEKAKEAVKNAAKSGGIVLFVGTQPAATEAVERTAREFGYPSVITRWLGGTLTNFRVISRRLDYFKKLRSDWASGAFQKYTKKEQVGIERELRKLTAEMASLENLTARPECVVVIDPNLHRAAVLEARKLKIPIVAFVNTDVDPEEVNYAVPGNNKARLSIEWFLSGIAEGAREGKNSAAAQATADKEALAVSDANAAAKPGEPQNPALAESK